MHVPLLVNGRIVHDFVDGATPWHDLPFSVADIEKIEVLRGANSIRYGVAAVSGVVHVYTRHSSVLGRSDHLAVEVDAYGGTVNTHSGRAALYYHPDDADWSAMISLNKEERERHQATFFSQGTGEYDDVGALYAADIGVTSIDFHLDDFITNPDQAMKQQGLLLQLVYDDEVDKQLYLDVGNSSSHHIEVGGKGYGTPFVEEETDSNHMNLRIKYFGLSAQIYRSAQQKSFYDMLLEFRDQVYESVINGSKIHYQWSPIKAHSIELIHEYRTVSLSNDDFVSGQYYGSHSHALALIDHWQFNDRLEFFLGARVEWLDFSGTIQTPIQIGANYRIYNNHYARVFFSQGYQEPNAPIYTDGSERLPNGIVYRDILGRDVAVHHIDLVEVGLRGKITDDLLYDIEVWYQESKGYFTDVLTGDNIFFIDVEPTNLPTRVSQWGMTFDVKHRFNHASYNNYLQYFLTLQKTDQKNVYIDPFQQQGFLESEESQATPRWFGGFVFNWILAERLNININGYYTDKSEITIAYNEPDSIEPIRVINAKLSLDFDDMWQGYLNFRNTRDSNEREFYKTDASRDMVLIGVNYKNTIN